MSSVAPQAASAEQLAERTIELVNISSESFYEGPIVDHFEHLLGGLAHLETVRIGDNLVARTHLGRGCRVVLAGHSDTVPANANDVARRDGDLIHGLGTADMKSGLAAMFEAVAAVAEPEVDVTFVIYAREEVAAAHSGLAEVARHDGELLSGDVALLGEPTSAAIEAGCQGSVRGTATFTGKRAHTARPWMGENAIHKGAAILAALDRYDSRQPDIQGCVFRESLLATRAEGGVAGNVVPDRFALDIAHRFAPDRSTDDAERWLRQWVGEFLGDGDTFDVTDRAPAAPPSLDHPVLRSLIDDGELAVRAKLGWTDVAFFAQRGVPAANFGPGDPLVAHTAGEFVDIGEIVAVHEAIVGLLTRSFA